LDRIWGSILQKDLEMGKTNKQNLSVGIFGFGWVGKFMKEIFPNAEIYDPNLAKYKNNLRQVNKCETSFICVPTPCPSEGALDMRHVEDAVSKCKSPLIVVRSTTNPGTCDKLAKKYKKRICHQPEYLGETPQHPLLDAKGRPFMIIGGKPKDRRAVIDLYATVYNANINIRQVTNYEAEVIKLSENRAVAFKVGQCQELYDACEKAGIDYYLVREAVYGDDFRFNLWWTFIYPDKRGFNSKCIPKDVYAWCAWAESLGYKPTLTRDLLKANKKYISGHKRK
jgi:UDP-glucose 6-dehydrogenase